MNDYNQTILKDQIDMRKTKNSNGMNDAEYLMNRELIEKAAKTLNPIK
jgi:hypothetical protein